MSFIVTLFLMMVYLITLLIVIILCALPGILVIGSAIWTHQDAKKYKAANEYPRSQRLEHSCAFAVAAHFPYLSYL